MRIPDSADVGVGVRVLEGHAQGLEEEGGEEERVGGPWTEALGKDLEEGADEEELAEVEVGCEEGICEGCEEPACKDGGVAMWRWFLFLDTNLCVKEDLKRRWLEWTYMMAM